MESLETLHDLFIEQLKDLHDAEKQLVAALPLMAKAAESKELRMLFKEHLQETKEQVRRLDRLFKGLEEKPGGKTCVAMKGLIAEANEALEEDMDPNVLDAALIVSAQKIEHYEMAGYGSVRTFARVLGYKDAAKILQSTLDEEGATDKKLTKAAEKLNVEAEVADEAEV